MRRLAIVLALIMLVSMFSGCALFGPGNSAPAVPTPGAATAAPLPADPVEAIIQKLGDDKMTCPEYDYEKYILPYWDTDVIYNESVLPLTEPDGSMAPIPLMYKADRILEVRNSFLDKLYVEGRDYTLDAEGRLVIPEGSSIELFDYNTYYPSKATTHRLNKKDGSGYLLWLEDYNLHQKQIAVTYVHTDAWKGTVPASQGSKFPNLIRKLMNREKVSIVIYGDSIATGCNSSSETNDPPYAETWFEMLARSLKVKYGYDDINIINVAVGGTDSAWGRENVRAHLRDDPRVLENGIDLAIIAFGMNDIATDPKVFCDNIYDIANTISFGYPDCEYVFIATMLANPESTFSGTQEQFLGAMLDYDFSYVGHYAIADMTTLYKDMLANKRYWDMSCNNVNHPVDFLARAYAMLMVKTLS